LADLTNWENQFQEPEIELGSTELLIDGDVIVYGALYNRWGSVYDGPEKQFTKEQDHKYLIDGILNLDTIIKNLKETLFAEHVKIAIKGENNFRYQVWPDYKKSRKQSSRPIKAFVQVLTECIIQRYNAIPAHGMESDDLLAMWRNESIAAGKTPVIASVDKDMLCLPGLHYRLPKGTCYGEESRDITRLIKVTDWEADRFYYKQLLMGDPTDSIPGLPDIGPKRAEAIISDCKTKEDLQYMVCYAYKHLIGEKWKEALITTGKLITLWPHPNYEFNLEGWNGA
jgi:5'-3' exonuclease